MKNRKLSVRTAHFLGQTIVNGGVILIMFGVWILSFVLVLKANLSVWFIFIGIFAGPLIAWMWWSFSIPRWRYWTRQHLNEEEIEELHRLSINSQLEWQRGHVLEKTEIRSSEYKQQDLSIAISSIEIFLNQRVPESVHDIKVAFPNLDTSVLDEIRGFIFNLKAMTSPTGDISNLSTSLDRLDELIHKLIGTTNTVKGRQGDVVDGWFYMVAELSNRLTKLRMVIKSYFSTGKDETESRKTSSRQFLVNLSGALIIYGGAILVMIGVWALSIFVMRLSRN